jgi:hypothetical protein
VGKSELGRLLDPKALDEAPGPRGRVRVDVPAAWLAEPCRIAVVVPRRVPCARCEGGGCDGCGKSGVLRAPKDEGARRIVASLPRACGDGVALRLSDPFGPEAGVSQIILEVHASALTSPGVSRLPPPGSHVERVVAVKAWMLLAGLAAIGAAIAAVLAR